MRVHATIFTAIALCVLSANGAITGRVQNEQGEAVRGVNVIYQATNDTVKTDSLGNFTIPVGTVTIRDSKVSANYRMELRNGTLALNLGSSATVKLSLADLRGRTIPLASGTLAAGNHTVKISSDLGSGVWILTGSIGEKTLAQKLTINGNLTASFANTIPAVAVTTNQSRSRAASMIGIEKKGYFSQTLSAASEDLEMGTIVLKRPDTWSFESHDKGAGINRPLLFPDFAVNKMKITVAPADWKIFMDDMASRYGAKRFWAQTPDPTVYDGKDGVGKTVLGENPVYIPVTIEYNGKKWEKVGLRCKGNASLSSSWAAGLKLPFKLTFDQFENKYPETNDQRFYGVKQLTMYNGNSDASNLREMVPGRLFRSAGVKISDRGFYETTIDFGVGERYLGIYTAVEIPWGQTMEDLFGENPDSTVEGNIYKPEGPTDPTLRKASMFGQGAIFNQTSFEKQNNYDKSTQTGDWSDVESIVTILHDSKRTTNPAEWRADLEAKFNVPQFIKTIAVAAAIDAFDSYGLAPHNYYLYGNPAEGGKINWTPYDLNWTLMYGPARLKIDQSHVTDSSWPLVWFLMQDPVYNKQYWDEMKDFNNNHFNTNAVLADIDKWWSLIRPYLLKEKVDFSQFYPTSYADNANYWDNEWESGIAKLKQMVQMRKTVVESACSSH